MVDETTETATPVPEGAEHQPLRHDRADQPVSETLERFLRFIVERVPLERIEEVHAFSPLRQGTVETGVAVVAARVEEPPPPETPEAETPDAVALEAQPTPDNESDATPEILEPDATRQIERHTVYTARYRLVIKGPERGKWEPDIVEEADAPLVTVPAIVAGVQRRAGEDSDIIRFTATQVARALRVEFPTDNG